MTVNNNLERVRFLESKRVFLTPATMDDFEDMYRFDHDREIVFLDDSYYRPKNIDNAREEYEKRLKADDIMNFNIILKENGANIGIIVAFQIDNYERKCYWGLLLTKEYRRKGIGTEVSYLLLRYLFEDLGFRRVICYTHSGNPGSIQFQEKLGFVREGVMRKEYFFDGQYYDSINYAMLDDEYRTNLKDKIKSGL